MSAVKVDYPQTRREDVVETVAPGVSFEDPYRWLEEENDEVAAWQARHAALAREYVEAWPDPEDRDERRPGSLPPPGQRGAADRARAGRGLDLLDRRRLPRRPLRGGAGRHRLQAASLQGPRERRPVGAVLPGRGRGRVRGSA